jgi:hypothetical protein
MNRDHLARLADELIPAESGMPSASQAGAVGEHLDRVLESRPDLEGPLTRIEGGLDGLPERDPEGWAALTAAVTAAYYMNAQVRERIGYEGQLAIPFDPDDADYLEDGLLASVQARGPLYRPTP